MHLTSSADSASALKLVIGVALKVAQVLQLVKDDARKPDKAAHPHWISHALHLPRVNRAQLLQSRKVVGCDGAAEDLRLDRNQTRD